MTVPQGLADIGQAGPGVDGDELDARLLQVTVEARSSSEPCRACLCRFEAASVTASASCSARAASGTPAGLARAWPAARQDGTALASSTASQRMSCGAGALSGQFSATI